MSGMKTTVTFFTRGIYLIKPAPTDLHCDYRLFCVCEIIVTFSSVDDEVGAVFDNNTNRRQQEDGAHEGDAPLCYFLKSFIGGDR